MPAQLLKRPSQIIIECNVLGKILVREEWKQNGSTREALPHDGIIFKVAGRKITGDIGKSVCDDRIKITIIEFLAHKGRMKKTTFDLVDWEAVDKIIRELWAKGASDKRIYLRAVHISQGKKVNDRERFSVKRWKRQWDQICGNITITNPTARRACNKKARRLGRRKRKNIRGR